MARFGVLVAAVAGVLFAVTARAAPTPNEAIPELCNPTVCMGLAILHSDCIDGFNPGPVIQNGVPGVTELTNCVCADAELKKNYLNCYGFCTLDPAKDPFCTQPVKSEVADADITAFEDPTSTASAELEERDDIAEREPEPTKLGRVHGWLGFCGVPGQACGEKMVATATEATETELPGGTDTAELEHADIAERAPEPTKLGRVHGWLGFCGVPGQACSGKFVNSTAGADGTAPTTLQTVKTPSILPTGN